MAEDVVIARFRADLDQVKKEFDDYIKSLEKVQKEEKDTQAETKKTGDVALTAAQKRANALKGEQAELKRLEAARKQAFTPKAIDEFNQKINQTKKNIANLAGETQKTGGLIKASLAGIGAGIAAAFSIQAVLAFGKASVDAFIDAEKNASKLKFAITSIGGESDAAFERLIKQSAEVEGRSIFSDDSIQNAQAALSAFGLTSKEIEKLIPKLADFATITGVDIAQAAEQVGAGLEGAGKEFKNYGIEVSATASRQENLNAILGGFEKFAGSAEEATKTLAGELAQATNQADNLQESIGERLAPAFVKLRTFFLETVDIIITSADDIRAAFRDQTIAEAATKSIELVKERAKTLEEIYKIPANDAYLKALEKEIELQQQAKDEASKGSLAKNIEEYQEADRALSVLNKELEQFTQLLETQKAAADAAAARVFDLTELQKKQTSELITLREKEKEIDDAASKGNIKNIEDIIKARDLAISELKKNQELLRRLQIQNIADEKQRRILAFEDEIRQLTAQGKLRADIIKQLEIELRRDLDAMDKVQLAVTIGVEGSVPKINDEIEVINDKLIPLELQIKPVVVTEGGEAGNLLDSFFKANAEIISSSQALVNELSNLYNQLAQNQIDSINKAKEAELEAIDSQLTANETALDKRRISETEAFLVEQELLKQQVKAEQEAEKKIRDIKRKQAIVDKAAAIIDITINTARAISQAFAQLGPIAGIPLAALMGALGAAQAAIVIAQPIPYKKGTKGAKGGLSLVGEEGPELMMLPKDSKVVNARSTSKHSKVIDAIQDDRFEDYVFKNYITPELEKQKRSYKESQEKSFASNISKSLVLQMAQGGKGDFYLERISKQGLPMSNVEQLASAIASKITQDIYRR